MNQKTNDPGLGEKYLINATRLINRDGSFNIKRYGAGFHHKDLYQFLINLTWPKFLTAIFTFYFIFNLIFAGIYILIGTNSLVGVHHENNIDSFTDTFFFSIQTFTTVGYGHIVPAGIVSNLAAAIEAMTGLLSFAIITGLLYGRFSKPSARILFSNNILVTRTDSGNALMFRIANQRNTNLMELEAKVLFSYIEGESGSQLRKYSDLKLERSSVYFFPLNWTLVHPIDEQSFLYGKTAAELEKMRAELLILVKGFDDTFSQVVHSRYSYKYDEIIWGAKFVRPYSTDEAGIVNFDLRDIHKYETSAM